MIDKNVKNCNLAKKIKDIIIVIVAVIIAGLVSDEFLKGSFVWTVVIMVVVMLILMPFGMWIDRKIEKHYDDKSQSK